MGIKVNEECFNNLRFADDIVLLSNSGDALKSMINDLGRQSRTIGPKVNVKKSEVMFDSHRREQQLTIGSRH